MPDWERAVAVVVVLAVTAILARLADRALARRSLPPEAVTRYRVLRRSVVAGIVALGILSALLAIPGIRPIAGGILASSAVLGLVIGFAAQTTLSNVAAGILIAFSEAVRLGDRVELAGFAGVVEEIALTYTLIRLDDGSRLVVPNTRLASDTIRNATIVSREKMAEITVQVPLTQELPQVVALLRAETAGDPEAEVFVGELADSAIVVVRARAADEAAAVALEHDLRVRAHERLRTAGVFA